MIPRTTTAAARLAFAWALIAVRAEPAGAQAIGYSLSPGSEFRTGCFEPPCACGPVQNPMTGTFALIRRPSTPPFANYDVVGVHWVVQFLVGVVTITGAGSYRVGGSGVAQQQLSLDLVVGGGPVRHFDSGLVAGGANFPRIEADISLYGGIGCGDTTLIVRAGAGGSTLDAGAPGLALAPLAPNPFRGATRLEFGCARTVRCTSPSTTRRDAACARSRTATGSPPAPMRWSGMEGGRTAARSRRASTSSSSRRRARAGARASSSSAERPV
jgi:hypothetical protein